MKRERMRDILGVEFLENGVKGFCKILFLDEGDEIMDVFGVLLCLVFCILGFLKYMRGYFLY